MDGFGSEVKNAAWPFFYTLVACSVVSDTFLEPTPRFTKTIVEVL
jgi:hypothetical protein